MLVPFVPFLLFTSCLFLVIILYKRLCNEDQFFDDMGTRQIENVLDNASTKKYCTKDTGVQTADLNSGKSKSEEI